MSNETGPFDNETLTATPTSLSGTQSAEAQLEAGQLNTGAGTAFNTTVLETLMAEGLDITQIPASQLATVISQLYADPQVATALTENQMNPGSTTVMAEIRDRLFTPGAYSNPDTLQAGLSWMAQQSVRLTTAQIGYLGPEIQQVPTPFNPAYLGDTTLTFGQHWNGETEQGVDYAMPVGTQLYSPFAGTIITQDMGKADWGKRVFVRLDNGYTFAIGHMTSFSVTSGERVQPGQLLGESGGAVTDPSSGNSSGPHVEIQWINPQGVYTDPGTMMQQIYKGTTFAQLGQQSAAGTGVSSANAQARLEGRDLVLEDKYPSIVHDWNQYFGNYPTGDQILQVANAAGNDAVAQLDYVRGLPSPDLPGASVGQTFDLQSQIDTAMQAEYGHNGTFAMVKGFFGQGITGPAFVKQQILNMGILDKIPQDAFASPGQVAGTSAGAPTPTPAVGPTPSPSATPTQTATTPQAATAPPPTRKLDSLDPYNMPPPADFNLPADLTPGAAPTFPTGPLQYDGTGPAKPLSRRSSGNQQV